MLLALSALAVGGGDGAVRLAQLRPGACLGVAHAGHGDRPGGPGGGPGLATLPGAAAVLLLVLMLHLNLLNQAPTNAYFAQTLQAWEQGVSSVSMAWASGWLVLALRRAVVCVLLRVSARRNPKIAAHERNHPQYYQRHIFFLPEMSAPWRELLRPARRANRRSSIARRWSLCRVSWRGKVR